MLLYNFDFYHINTPNLNHFEQLIFYTILMLLCNFALLLSLFHINNLIFLQLFHFLEQLIFHTNKKLVYILVFVHIFLLIQFEYKDFLVLLVLHNIHLCNILLIHFQKKRILINFLFASLLYQTYIDNYHYNN